MKFPVRQDALLEEHSLLKIATVKAYQVSVDIVSIRFAVSCRYTRSAARSSRNRLHDCDVYSYHDLRYCYLLSCALDFPVRTRFVLLQYDTPGGNIWRLQDLAAFFAFLSTLSPYHMRERSYLLHLLFLDMPALVPKNRFFPLVGMKNLPLYAPKSSLLL